MSIPNLLSIFRIILLPVFVLVFIFVEPEYYYWLAVILVVSGPVSYTHLNIWDEKKNLRALRFHVGLVFQYPEYQLFEETVYKDIAFGPKNMGLSEQEVDTRVREAAGFVGLREELLEKSPFELSGGQKRRAAIAGVIAMQPKVLILDEPTAGLDPKGREQILKRIKMCISDRQLLWQRPGG